MKNRRNRNSDESSDDNYMRALLKYHDLVTPPDAAQLSALEGQILRRLDRLPAPGPLGDVLFPFLATGREWVVRGACLVAVLSVMLGFIAGRGFYELSSQSANANALFTPSGGASWQSFLDSPVAAGDSYDAAE